MFQSTHTQLSKVKYHIHKYLPGSQRLSVFQKTTGIIQKEEKRKFYGYEKVRKVRKVFQQGQSYRCHLQPLPEAT